LGGACIGAGRRPFIYLERSRRPPSPQYLLLPAPQFAVVNLSCSPLPHRIAISRREKETFAGAMERVTNAFALAKSDEKYAAAATGIILWPTPTSREQSRRPVQCWHGQDLGQRDVRMSPELRRRRASPSETPWGDARFGCGA